MKTYTKTIWNICACMLIILLGGCADDDIIRNDCGSTLQDRISSNKHVLLAGRQNSHTRYERTDLFQLRSLSDNSIQLMEGKIRENAGFFPVKCLSPIIWY